jgi:hypothetical protein
MPERLGVSTLQSEEGNVDALFSENMIRITG